MRRALTLALAVVALVPAARADAAWTAAGSGSARASATTVAPTGTLTSSCGTLQASVKLTWTATSTPWADGYEIRWGTSSGSYTSSATTSSTSTSFTSPALALGTYYFAVRATKGNWRSANSNEVSRTIVSVLGVGTCV